MRNREGPVLVSGSGFLLVLIPSHYECVGGATMYDKRSVTQNTKALISSSLEIRLKLVFCEYLFSQHFGSALISHETTLQQV